MNKSGNKKNIWLQILILSSFPTLFVQKKNYNILVLDIVGQEIQFNKKFTHLPRFQIYASHFPL